MNARAKGRKLRPGGRLTLRAGGRFADYFALALSAAASVAPYKWKADVLLVVIVSGAVGLFRPLLF